MEKIIITAANGFMGKHLVEHLSTTYQVIALVRSEVPRIANVEYVKWDGKQLGAWKNALEGAKCVINLAGRSVDCRYNDKNKAAIYASRLESTDIIGQAIKNCTLPP
ncbi:MAG: NAD-dependent epimerase/dehydratase family protein, partial [Crocinitomicaceae bacterium]|nr:NAD-dependent epimerase/dehydratase family protein [Crocinitomicaceae bacterium]